MEVYLQTIFLLREYFKEDTEAVFLHGGCFFLAQYLHSRIRSSEILINRAKEHCAVQISYHGLYDITGKISAANYKPVTIRELQFMKNNYIPPFNSEIILEYLERELDF